MYNNFSIKVEKNYKKVQKVLDKCTKVDYNIDVNKREAGGLSP